MSHDASPRAGWRAALGRTVLALGVVSLFTDAASDMVWPLMGVFLRDALHTSVAFLGLIEAVAEATASVAKYLAGRYSDRLVSRKPVVLLGYGLSSVVRPLVALAATPWQVLAVRFVDRAGKGVRTAPRDALLAAATTAESRATAFGFHRAMDNLGAVLGPLIAAAVLWAAPGRLRLVFALSAVPGALALVALALLVPRDRAEPAGAGGAAKKQGADEAPLTAEFWRYLAAVALFSLANASDFFIVARAQSAGVPERALPLVWGGLSLLRAVGTAPGGRVADRIGRGRSVALGWGLYAVAYAGFAVARTPAALLAAVLAYGAHYALTEGAERALVASFATRASLGRAYGLFALATGAAAVPANALFGALYARHDGRDAFLASAAVAALAALSLSTWARPREGRGAAGTSGG